MSSSVWFLPFHWTGYSIPRVSPTQCLKIEINQKKMMDEHATDKVNNPNNLESNEDATMDWLPSEMDNRRSLESLTNGAAIKREIPDYSSSRAELEPQPNHSKVQIKEEVREDFNTASGSGYFQNNGAHSDWFLPRSSGSLLGEQAPALSSLDTLQRMMQRFEMKPNQEFQNRPPVLDPFSSPDRHQNLPWMDRNLSPYSYPYFSVGLTPQSSSSTDSPRLSTTQPNREYPCKKCTFKANSKKELDGHLKEEHYKVSCPYCNYISTSQGRMTRHVEYAHGPKENSTREQNGDASPNSSEGSVDHVVLLGSKTLKKPKKCKICKNLFHTKNDYFDHMNEHYPILIRCDVRHCKFVTHLPHHMRYHRGMHNGDKSFECTECNYKCATTSMLKSHMKCHDTVCRYRCATCSFAAKHANALNSHLKRTGHVAGPVLSPDGSIPVDEANSKFENHVRKKPLKSSASTTSDLLPTSSMPQLTAEEKDILTQAYPLPKIEPPPFTQPMESSPLNSLIPAPVSSLFPPHLPPQLPPQIPPHLPLPHPVFSPHRFQMAQMYMQNIRYMNSLMPHSFNFGLPFPWSTGPSGSPYTPSDGFLNKQNLIEHMMSSTTSQSNPSSAPSQSTPSVNNNNTKHELNDVKSENVDDLNDCQPLDLSMKPSQEKRVEVQTERKDPSNRKSRRKGVAHKLDLRSLTNDMEMEVTDENCDQHNIPDSFESSCDQNIPRTYTTTEKRLKTSPSTDSSLPELEPIARHESLPPFVDGQAKGFPCHYCQVVFKDKRMFSSHVQLHSPGDPYHCSDCQRSFQNGREFFLHLSEFEHKLFSTHHLS